MSLCFAAGCSADTGSAHTTNKVTSSQNASAETITDARIVAVLSYADWCSSCKILDPKLRALKASAPIEGVQHLTLDYTDRDAAAYFDQAAKAGVGPAIKAYLKNTVKTGIVMLVDLETGAVIGQLTKNMSADELREALEKAAA